MKFIIEHLEPELFDWCLIEYKHISEIIGKNNLIFTNIKNKKDQKKLKRYGTVYNITIAKLNFKKLCVLSQYSKKTLETNDKNKFDYFVFGGILGNNPAQERTKDIATKLKKKKIKFEERNLGHKQMPTDVAVYVARNILNGKKLSDFKLVDELEIEINENESLHLPFRYVVDNNKVVISNKLVAYLRAQKKF